jgi:hypothetical protein
VTERPGSEREGNGRPAAPQPWMPPGARTTPNAEKYLLEADALRRRQLVSALLHGSRRTWREQRRIWPSVVAGIVVVAVIVAVFGVLRAVHSADSNSAPVPTHRVISLPGR